MNLASQVAVLKAAADPSRLRLLCICSSGEFTVSELTLILGQSQPRVSGHLRTLCDAGLLLRFRERHFVYYRVPAETGPREMVRTLLAGLAVDDQTLATDRTVMARIRAARDERAREVLATVEADTIEANFPPELADRICAQLNLDALGDLLDIGTGSGRVLQLLAPFAVSAVGIDISSDILTVARSNLGAAGLGDVMVRHGDMYRLPYADQSFDTVTLDNVLSHARSPRQALREAARTLRPGGVLLVIEARREEAPRNVTTNTLKDWVNAAALTLHRSEHFAHPSMDIDLHVVGAEHDAVAA